MISPRERTPLRLRGARLFAPLKDCQLFVEARNHFSNASLGKSLGADRMSFQQVRESVLQ